MLLKKTVLGLAVLAIAAASRPVSDQVGERPDGSVKLPNHQDIRPAGSQVAFFGRPVDLALSPDGKTLAALANNGVLLLAPPATGDATVAAPKQLGLRGKPGSMGGLAWSRDGRTLYVSTHGDGVEVFRRGPDGDLAYATHFGLSRKMSRPTTITDLGQGPPPDGAAASRSPKRSLKVTDPLPVGLALTPNGRTLLACLNRANALAWLDTDTGAVMARLPLGVAPGAILLSPDGGTAYVVEWGGPMPGRHGRRAMTSGTLMRVDRHGAAATGSVAVVDVAGHRLVRRIRVGPHPMALALSSDGRRLYVACASDDQVWAIDPRSGRTVERILTQVDPRLPLGSMPDALALSPDGGTLYVALGGDNAVAVVRLGRVARGTGSQSLGPIGADRDGSTSRLRLRSGSRTTNHDSRPAHAPSRSVTRRSPEASRIEGLIPTGWFPGALALSAGGRRLMVANTKGTGSRWGGSVIHALLGYNTHLFSGTFSFIDLDPARLPEWTRTVRQADAVDATLADLARRPRHTPPVPVPERMGEPSVFHHVVYIIKENRTYDQVFGDLPQGNGMARLVQFGRKVIPNQRALAQQFVLLDNFYTCGVLSADGHQWTDEAYTTEYLEKAFGGWPRSYPYGGNDALAIAPTGFLWDNVLDHGLTFRDYGEMAGGGVRPAGATWTDLWRERQHPTGRYTATPHPPIARLRAYVRRGVVNGLALSDQWRADRFIADMRAADAHGHLPALMILALPDDHTAGTTPGMPTPEAMVADNDLAVGRIVDAVSHSRFWKDTVIFTVEDDSQSGADHVDGHRSPALCISPYTRRHAVDHDFTTQVSVVRTIEQILGLPPMNGFDAAARPMFGCFQPDADLTPFTVLPNQIPLDRMNPPLSALRGPARRWALASMRMDFSEPDRADPQTLNHILWHATKGYGAPYPKLR